MPAAKVAAVPAEEDECEGRQGWSDALGHSTGMGLPCSTAGGQRRQLSASAMVEHQFCSICRQPRQARQHPRAGGCRQLLWHRHAPRSPPTQQHRARQQPGAHALNPRRYTLAPHLIVPWPPRPQLPPSPSLPPAAPGCSCACSSAPGSWRVRVPPRGSWPHGPTGSSSSSPSSTIHTTSGSLPCCCCGCCCRCCDCCCCCCCCHWCRSCAGGSSRRPASGPWHAAPPAGPAGGAAACGVVPQPRPLLGTWCLGCVWWMWVGGGTGGRTGCSLGTSSAHARQGHPGSHSLGGS